MAYAMYFFKKSLMTILEAEAPLEDRKFLSTLQFLLDLVKVLGLHHHVVLGVFVGIQLDVRSQVAMV